MSASTSWSWLPHQPRRVRRKT